jgi:hypothetical protein
MLAKDCHACKDNVAQASWALIAYGGPSHISVIKLFLMSGLSCACKIIDWHTHTLTVQISVEWIIITCAVTSHEQ